MAVEKWMDLNGKVVIVTGGSQGIGEHVVQNLRANNAFVVVADLRIMKILLKIKELFLLNAMWLKNLMLKIW